MQIQQDTMNEKLVAEFYDLGCTTETQAWVALQAYLELCEVKRYWNVEYKFDSELGRMYLMAKKLQTSAQSIFLPVFDSEKLSFLKLQELLNISKKYEQESIYLVFVSSDSTTVYYQIVQGLEKPTDTSAKHLRENRQEKLDAELRKNRTLLEHSALLGIPITINQGASGNKTNT